MSEEIKSCENCRHDHNHLVGYKHDWGGIGGDCNPPCDGKTDFSWWKEFKRCRLELCKGCINENDPCNLDCYDCQDNKNWTPLPTLIERIDQEIYSKRNEIKKLHELKKRVSLWAIKFYV